MAIASSRVRVALLGCGTVGGGVVRLLKTHAETYAARVGAPIEITSVVVKRPRDSSNPATADLAGLPYVHDADAVFAKKDFDVVLEMMGGLDPARSYVERALDMGVPVVTANKMLLATHGPALFARADRKGVPLAFEGAVGGGIPIVRILRDALASDEVVRLRGIVNGTSNYILTNMRGARLSFADALAAAQAAGYAEADPSLDVDGGDAAHKLVVLAMLAFRAEVDHAAIPTTGIRDLELVDHDLAERFGFVIKHLAIGEACADGSLDLRVHPALVPANATLANVNGVLNAIELEGAALGPCLLSGRGAGAEATAVSVVADLLDVARARVAGEMRAARLPMQRRKLAPPGDAVSRHYLRFTVPDRPGVLGRITGALGDSGVSIEQMVQQGGGEGRGAAVQVVLLTHAAKVADISSALAEIAKSDLLASAPRWLRVV